MIANKKRDQFREGITVLFKFFTQPYIIWHIPGFFMVNFDFCALAFDLICALACFANWLAASQFSISLSNLQPLSFATSSFRSFFFPFRFFKSLLPHQTGVLWSPVMAPCNHSNYLNKLHCHSPLSLSSLYHFYISFFSFYFFNYSREGSPDLLIFKSRCHLVDSLADSSLQIMNL